MKKLRQEAPYERAFVNSFTTISNITQCLPEARRQELLAQFATAYPELATHVINQAWAEKEIDVEIFRRFDPNPYEFLGYLLMMNYWKGLEINWRPVSSDSETPVEIAVRMAKNSGTDRPTFLRQCEQAYDKPIETEEEWTNLTGKREHARTRPVF